MLKTTVFCKDFQPWEKPKYSSSEKVDIFLTYVSRRQSVADTSLTFCTNVSGRWTNGKAFTVLFPRLFVKIASDYGC